jgi:hypothetical protein
MSSSFWFRMRASLMLGAMALLAFAGTTTAATITVQAQKQGYARDGGINADPVTDGQFDAFYLSDSSVYVSRSYSNGNYGEYRTGVNFQLPSELMQPGTTINSAKIRVWVQSESVVTADVIVVHGIPGSGAPFVPDDFELVNPLASVPVQTSASWGTTYPRWPQYREFQVANQIQSLVGSTNPHASFTFSIANLNTSLTWYSGLSLIVDYSPPALPSPTLTILAPTSGLTFLQNDSVTFEATAVDTDGANLNSAIQWISSRNGPLEVGASFTTNSLLPGAHVITASVTGIDGNTSTKTINVTVQSTDTTPPALTLLAPSASGAQFVKGTAINFQATAFDSNDGDRSGFIKWTSDVDGVIGTGGSISVSTLSAGMHHMTVWVNDTSNNAAAQVFDVYVQTPNTAPTVTILSPVNGASLTAGVSFSLSANASDAQQGNMGSSLQWLLDGSTPLAMANNALATIATAGPHTITARVTDSGGLIGEHSVNVNVASQPPPPSSYCSLRGNTSSYEWIAAVRPGTVANASGNNGGYRDYTSVQFNMTAGTSTSIVLTPGFSGGSYSERWAVWIDVNRDMTFGANELFVNTGSSSAVSTAFTIPAGTTAGPARMRVAMSYGSNTPPSCGTFSYGEVEDYTVNIQASASPPAGTGSYCASRGTTSTSEFIQQIVANGTTRVSGNNSGYGDFTSSAPIALTRGTNYFALTPGFASSNYTEHWAVWIDFNKDGTFGTEDRVLTGYGSSTVNGSATVPSNTASGVTRMRVQMKYGAAPTACETIGYGEVEDYAVQIP